MHLGLFGEVKFKLSYPEFDLFFDIAFGKSQNITYSSLSLSEPPIKQKKKLLKTGIEVLFIAAQKTSLRIIAKLIRYIFYE